MESYPIRVKDLSLFVCYDCGNHFFILELPLGINDPNFCPYCGTDFELILEIEEDEEEEE